MCLPMGLLPNLYRRPRDFAAFGSDDFRLAVDSLRPLNHWIRYATALRCLRVPAKSMYDFTKICHGKCFHIITRGGGRTKTKHSLL